ncbi:type VII secretion integral membrane protein EccD [Nocardioides cynanchi]|uniref:type VII secretion integral membrane protein EccD n=1 Tax=Nocardioides cynanchi TaxID=2558918 RepID=UPI00124627B9|nr:type VII secretion integral membrane protein EccD [Nocardioides cynanchi]
MSQAPIGASGLVRVTVTSGTRRVDLVLPGAVPVAELVPELARSVGLLDAVTVYGGYRLVTQDGRALATDSGLTIQGVEDGGVITVAAGVDDEPPRVYDDVVEAMTDVVERDLRPWDAAAGRRTALWAAVALLALGAAALLLQHTSDIAGAATVVVAVVLVLGAVVLSRVQGETDAAVTVALVGCGYAAVSGLMLGWDATFFGTPVAAAGGGALAAGLVAALGLGQGRSLLLPPVVVGGIFLATGLVMRSSSYDAAVMLTTVLALVVIAGSVFPWLALGATGTSVEQLFSTADIVNDPEVIDPERVGADARVAHEILVAVSATVGLLLVLVSPLAVSLGLAGTVVAVLACVVVMLRTRQYRTGAEVLVGLVAGVLGLLATALSALWLHPGWRPGAAVALAVTGAVLLALTLLPQGTSVRRGRLGDVAETVALLGLLPALVLATGVFSAIRS